ncbi:MAG: hypothetical protein Unbinned1190contig1000_36 [Prokaryotic dsDNA virus sp.]|nr:MAG: hypothetical protein Unbinned1190contig1000_36 [Prokaryotic dsDNA virus sp.]|tara:strand:+ start:2099 stop:2998 length:900 start_codon:yes stop_codon:yes gene_type:complete
MATDANFRARAKATKEIRKTMRVSTSVLKAKLARLLLNPDRQGVKRLREAGRLDTRRLSAVKTGNTNVFKTKWKEKGFTTAVSILIDNSGSMGGIRQYNANGLALVLGDALEEAGVTFNMMAFPGIEDRRHDKCQTYVDAQGNRANGYWRSRDEGACISEGKTTSNHYGGDVTGRGGTLIKGFRDPWIKREGFVARIKSVGGTPLDKCMAWAGLQMRSRPEDRKVMLVLTDGCVGPREASIVRLLTAWGIEAIGVGIGSVKINSTFPVGIDGCHAGNLCTEVLDTLIRESDKYRKAHFS